jgi:ABC-type polar amino acid transport system ATPase subunit
MAAEIDLASRQSRRQRAKEHASNRVGLSDKASAYPVQLSGGEQQRITVARSLAMNYRLPPQPPANTNPSPMASSETP